MSMLKIIMSTRKRKFHFLLLVSMLVSSCEPDFTQLNEPSGVARVMKLGGEGGGQNEWRRREIPVGGDWALLLREIYNF